MIDHHGGVHLFHTIDHFECDVLSFSITIQPKTECLALPSFVLYLF